MGSNENRFIQTNHGHYYRHSLAGSLLIFYSSIIVIAWSLLWSAKSLLLAISYPSIVQGKTTIKPLGQGYLRQE